MRAVIEFCNSNRSLGTDEVIRKLEQIPDVDVIVYGCLGNCGECFYAPYALVNGEMIAAPTAEELYDKIIQAIEGEDDPYAWIDEQL